MSLQFKIQTKWFPDSDWIWVVSEVAVPAEDWWLPHTVCMNWVFAYVAAGACSMDKAKTTRKRSKPDKHGHGERKSTQEAGDSIAKTQKAGSFLSK
ncbi:hypothetical protein Tco_1389804, partial [Tanacetum coccineum]